MADTYRGLTIRLGGDASSLIKSLATVNSAATVTQSRLKTISRALRDDPGSTDAMERQLENVQNKARETATRLSQLRDAMRQLGETRLDSVTDFRYQSLQRGAETIADIAANTRDAGLQASEALRQYNLVDSELATIYRKVKDWSGIDLRETFDRDSVVDELHEMGVLTDEQTERFHTLRDSWKTAFSNLNVANAVQQLDKLGTNITADEAALRSLSQQGASVGTAFSRIANVEAFGAIERQVKSLDGTMGTLEARGRELEEALSLDPGNTELVEASMRNLSEQVDLAEQRASLLREQIGTFDSGTIDRVTSETRDWAREVDETREAYVEARRELTEAEGELEKLVEKQREMAATGDDSGEGYQELSRQVEQARQRVDALSERMRDASDAYDSARACDELQQLMDSAAQTDAQIESLSGRLSELGTSDLGKRLQETGGTLKDVGSTLTNEVTQRIKTAASATVSATSDIDSAFRDMKKTVDGTPEQFDRLKQAALDFSTTHVTTAEQILEIEAMGGQLGIAVEDLEDFANTASNLDIATDIDADTVSQQMGQLVNIMGDLNVTADKTHGGLGNFADSLVRLGNNMPALESDIMDITARIAAQNNIVGMSTPQTLAWATALASSGMQSEAAGTAFSKTVSMIEAAVAGGTSAVADYAEQAGMSVEEFVERCNDAPDSLDAFAETLGMSGEKLAKEVKEGEGNLEDFAKVAHMTADEFATAWKEDPSSAMEAFVKGLKESSDAGKSMDTILTNLGINSVRQKQAIETLTQTVDTMDDSLQMSQDAWDGVSDQWGEAGDAAREAAQKSEGFSGSMQKLENSAKAMGSALGDAAAPAISKVADAMGDAAQAFTRLPEGTRQTIVAATGIAAAAGPVIKVVGNVTEGIGKLKVAYDGLSVGGQAAVSMLGEVGAALAIGDAVAGAIGELHRLAIGYQESADAASAAVSGLDSWTQEAAAIQGATVDVSTAFSDSGQSAATLQGQVSDAFSAITSTIEYETSKWGQLTEGGVEGIREQLGRIDDLQGQTASAFGNAISAVTKSYDHLDSSNVVQYTRDVDAAFEQGKDQLDSTLQSQLMLIEAYHAQVGDVGSEAYQADVQAAQAAYDQGIALLQQRSDEAIQSVSSMYDRLGDETRDGWGKLADLQKDWVLKGASGIWDEFNRDDIEKQFNDLISTVDMGTTGAWMAAQAATVSAGKELDSATKANIDSILDSFDDLPDFLQDEGTSAMRSLASAIEQGGVELGDVGSMSAQQLVDKLREVFGQVPEVALTMAEALRGVGDGAFADLADSAGVSIDELAERLTGIGVTAEDVNNVSSEAFSSMLASCGGSIDQLVADIAAYNGTPIDPKTATIDVNDLSLKDAQGDVVLWNGTELEHKDGSAVVEDEDLVDAQGNLWTWNGTVLEPKSTTAEVTGNVVTGEAKKAIDDTKGASERFKDKTTAINATGNVPSGAAKLQIDLAKGAEDSLYSKSITITASTGGAYNNLSTLKSLLDGIKSKSISVTTNRREIYTTIHTPNARGGIRTHAEGAIAVSAVPLDIVGEAGAEAIVPLTNKRYSEPFARTLAEQMLKVAGGQHGTAAPTYVANVAGITIQATSKREFASRLADVIGDWEGLSRT